MVAILLRSGWTLMFLILSGVLAADWIVHVPVDTVYASRGSSVVLNCSYDYPEELHQGTKRTVLSEMWCLNNSLCITPKYVYHSKGIFPEPSYQGRVQYFGQTGSKNCSLTISDLRSADSGVYVFRFITDHLKAKLPEQRGVTLQVFSAPRNTTVLVNTSGEILQGTSLTLTCVSDANPSANFTWFKANGNSSVNKGSGPKFTILNANSKDSGQFICMAQNNWGKQNATFQITVQTVKAASSSTIGIVFGIILILIITSIVICIIFRKRRERSTPL